MWNARQLCIVMMGHNYKTLCDVCTSHQDQISITQLFQFAGAEATLPLQMQSTIPLSGPGGVELKSPWSENITTTPLPPFQHPSIARGLS